MADREKELEVNTESRKTRVDEQHKQSLRLDLAKLATAASSDQGDVFVLQWASKVENTLKVIDPDVLAAEHSALEASILSLVQSNIRATSTSASATASSSSASAPKAGRPLRHILSRILILIFQRTDSRALFDTLQSLMRTVNSEDTSSKSGASTVVATKESKLSALYLIGEVFGTLGKDVMSLFNEINALCLKIIKNEKLGAIMRFNALVTLRKSLEIGARSLNDVPGRELLKALKSGLGDKAGSVIRGCSEVSEREIACCLRISKALANPGIAYLAPFLRDPGLRLSFPQCLSVLRSQTDLFSTRSEIESILQVAFKSLETSDFVTKRSISKMSADLLASSQVENSAPIPLASKKSAKKKQKAPSAGGAAEEDSEEEEIAAQQAAAKAASITDENFRTLISPKEMLTVLSNVILKKDSTRKLRLGVLDIYQELFGVLGSKWCLIHYTVIASHLFDYLPNQMKAGDNFSRHEFCVLKRGIAIILRDLIGLQMLSESGQMIAIQELTDLFLKKYPILTPGLQPASETSLMLSLDEVSGLLIQLGSIPLQIFECLYDPLIRLLSHPKNSVQISSAWCLRIFCETNPIYLSKTTEKLLESVKKDIKVLNSGNKGNGIGNELPKRLIGNSRALAILLNLIPTNPLYSSFEISSKIMDLAIDLLKNSGDHELSVSALEIQVSWTLIGALVTLGPNFVRMHLTQLFNLWKIALPKPPSKDEAATSRSSSEWSFLLSIKESALSGLLSFLNHSSELLTLDTSRKIISLLTNTLSFSVLFANQHPSLSSEYSPGEERTNLTLLDRENLLKRRIFQCFSKFKNSSNFDFLPQKELIEISLSTFGHPDRYIGSSVQASIVASSGNFKSIWDLEDGYAFGISSLVRDEEAFVSDDLDPDDMNYPATTNFDRRNYKNRDLVENRLDCLARRPLLGAGENDPLILYSSKAQASDLTALNPGRGLDDDSERSRRNRSPPLPPPLLTGVVDASIQLFASLIQFQERDFQIKIFETLHSYTRSLKLEKNPGRKTAVQLNIMIAILGVLRASSKGMVGPNGRKPSGFNNERLSSTLKDIIKDGLLHEDVNLRSVSAETFGRLAAVAGSHSMSSQVQFLVDQVVSNRDPNARAGCVLAFGEIYEKIGGLSAGPLTKTIVNILLSLSNDPNPIVHYYSLESLKTVIDAASLSYSPYVPSTLGMLVKLYFNETHEPDGGTVGSITLKSDHKAYIPINKVIKSIIGVFGPDLKEEAKIRELILILLEEFSTEEDVGVVVESIKSLQHFSLFTDHDYLELNAWIEKLRSLMRSNKSPLRIVSVNAFYQLVQREALSLSRTGGAALVEELFAVMNSESQISGLRETLLSWLRQTADKSPIGWIDLCQRIITGSSAKLDSNATNQLLAGEQKKKHDLQDEESATLDLGDNTLKENSDLVRWRTQLFALKCLHEIFETLKRSSRFHLFVQGPASPDSQDQIVRRNLLTSKVSDLIKMAFTASTSPILRIRLEGLVILKDVIENFKNERDLDFEEAMLLEQHQAPITAALTPAFTVDSTPEVLASAVQVCATFVGSGTVREVEKMGRILKLLVNSLESCMDSCMSQLGDVRDLSPNASAMLKISVFRSWADLQVSTLQQPYLIQVIRPHLRDLVPFWISCLREYAKIDTDPETAGLSSSGPGPVVNEILESEYAASAREVVAPYYKGSWLQMLNAVSSLMGSNDKIVDKALDGESTKDSSGSEGSRSEQTPARFFFVLYGLAFQALSVSSSSAIRLSESSNLDHDKIIALNALKSLINRRFAGDSLLTEVGLLNELFNQAFRLVITETIPVKIKVLDMVVGLVESHGHNLLDGNEPEDALPNNAKLTYCLRIITYAITQASALAQSGSADEGTALIRTAYGAYCRVIRFYSSRTQEALYVVALFNYSEMLRDETSEVDLVGPTLSSLKELCERGPQVTGANNEVLSKAIHGFLSAALQNVDDMRTRAGRVAENKTKNSLLAATVVLTSLPSSIALSKSVIEYLCFLLSQKASLSVSASSSNTNDVSQTVVQTALFCIRSLLLASSRAAPAVLYSVGQLLPSMVQLVVDASNSIKQDVQESGEVDRNDYRLVALEETSRALVALLSIVGEDLRARWAAILLPTLILLLNPTPNTPKSEHLHTVSVGHLLGLASSHQSAFRQATAVLDSDKKALLETSIRNAITSKSSKDTQKSIGVGSMNLRDAKQKEGISLRSFG